LVLRIGRRQNGYRPTAQLGKHASKTRAEFTRWFGADDEYICAEAHFLEGGKERRAGILIA
jgi:hypothetical protein